MSRSQRLAQYTQSVPDSEQPRARWWQPIAFRRRYMSDRTWFGAAFGVGFGAATAASLLYLIPAPPAVPWRFLISHVPVAAPTP
jgi:hypothetical protein